MGYFSKKSIAVTISVLAILLFFQNCGPQFRIEPGTTSLESLTGNTDTEAPAPETENPTEPVPMDPPPTLPPVVVPNASPQITAPVAPISVGMNVSTKIVIRIVDLDSDQSLVNYMIRVQPQQGTLTVDAGSVPANNRGVTYTPRRNFVGADSFVLNVVDPQGNMGPDQRFNISVDAKGIGQMVGTFVKSTCTPNTSPLTGSYVSTATSFTLSMTYYTQDCSAVLFRQLMEGNHSVGLENVMTASNVTGFEYNVTNQNLSILSTSALGIRTLNTQRYCGLADYIINVPRSLNGIGCNGIWRGPNVYMYRRVVFTPGQQPVLYFSSSTIGGDGNTPQTRSRGLQLNIPFVRMP